MTERRSVPPQLDHLVYAVNDLAAGIGDMERLLGVRAVVGGQHPGRGTRNALLGIGESSYLEIVGPDPLQTVQQGRRWFGVGEPTCPRIAAWAARWPGLAQAQPSCLPHGVTLGPTQVGKRSRVDGSVLHWTFTDPTLVPCDGVVPFLIDWGLGAHPAASAPRGAELIGLRAEHPVPGVARDVLAALEVSLDVTLGPGPALIATFETRHGVVELR